MRLFHSPAQYTLPCLLRLKLEVFIVAFRTCLLITSECLNCCHDTSDFSLEFYALSPVSPFRRLFNCCPQLNRISWLPTQESAAQVVFLSSVYTCSNRRHLCLIQSVCDRGIWRQNANIYNGNPIVLLRAESRARRVTWMGEQSHQSTAFEWWMMLFHTRWFEIMGLGLLIETRILTNITRLRNMRIAQSIVLLRAKFRV